MNTTKHERMAKQIEAHGRNLLALYPDAIERDPVKLCKKLMRVERAARKYTTDYCNGDVQPTENYSNIELLETGFLHDARRILGAIGPAIIINHDCRGYALKIDSDDMQKNHYELYRDMGGYGIICPTFDGE